MKKSKDVINKEARQAYMNHLNKKNIGGSIIADMGTGKTKIGLDIAVKDLDVLSCLVVSPRSNLTGSFAESGQRSSWQKQIDEWYPDDVGRFKLETIQTAYKFENYEFDLLIMDEVHTIFTEKYSDLLRNNKFKYILGLTGTDGMEIEGKYELYKEYAPIIYEYMNSANDGLINKSRVLVFERELNNNFKMPSGSKKKPFMQGEFSKYEYHNKEFEKQKIALITIQKRAENSGDVEPGMHIWQFAREWGYNNKAPNSKERAIAMKFLNAIQFRKKMLHNLPSGVFYAKTVKEAILKKDPNNKVLLFTEEVSQADKISNYVYHSKLKEDDRKKNLEMFDSGEIRELGSSKGLILGLNIEGATHGVLESYVGSTVDNPQKKGRGHRLDPDDVFTLVLFVVRGTQQEKWFDKIIGTLNTNDITYYDDIRKLIKDL